MCVDVADQEHVRKSGGGPARRLRVGIAGLGVIGEGAALRLAEETDDYELCATLVRDRHKPRSSNLKDLRVYTNGRAFLSECPDVIIDALPNSEVGRSLIKTALEQGVSIISANKQAIAGVLKECHELARKNEVRFAYAASVGGGAPMVETVRETSSDSDITSLTAILNGTVNYILSAVADGAAFDDAVHAAQEAGFAEPDPSADLSGDDARAKISILAYEAFGKEVELDAVEVEPLTAERAAFFADTGSVWKQISTLERLDGAGLSARVQFKRVDDDPFFRAVKGEGNALRVETASGDISTCEGLGAGRAPTVDSLFADLETVRIAATIKNSSLKNAPRLP